MLQVKASRDTDTGDDLVSSMGLGKWLMEIKDKFAVRIPKYICSGRLANG